MSLKICSFPLFLFPEKIFLTPQPPHIANNNRGIIHIVHFAQHKEMSIKKLPESVLVSLLEISNPV